MANERVAIVTGGGSGLGLSTAKKFCAEGIRTIITGRTLQKLEEAKKECGDLCDIVQLDMTATTTFESHINDIVSRYGSIDILVNNAGVNMKKKFEEMTDDEFRAILETNTVGLFALSREVVKQMKKQSSGVIINVSSMVVYYGIPYVIAYTASKGAVHAMTHAMAVELAEYGIRVNAVAPGFIKTPMTAKALDSDVDRKTKVMGRTPMNKMGCPDDIAEAIYFLASDQAKFITGESLKVDGGNSIGF